MSLLCVRNLTVEFPAPTGLLRAVDSLDFSVGSGEVLGIVGESGSGKSASMLALMGLLGGSAHVSADSITFGTKGLNLLASSHRRQIIGKEISMIFQDPQSCLNPSLTVGYQIMETLVAHTDLDSRARRARAIELLDQVGIPAARRRVDAYPHELSGGMSQRAMIAGAIACAPRLLIADEPTTALDSTIQAQILQLLLRLRGEQGMSIILITHDMGVVAHTADRVLVMYGGKAIEAQDTSALFGSPRHPYTAALLRALPERSAQGNRLETIPGALDLRHAHGGCRFEPRCGNSSDLCRNTEPPAARYDRDALVRCHFPIHDAFAAAPARGQVRAVAYVEGDAVIPELPLLQAADLTKEYRLNRGVFMPNEVLRVLRGISFKMRKGRTLAIVGESGCGKSTLARLVAMIEQPSTGSLQIGGRETVGQSPGSLRVLRPKVQMVFQNPYASLNPRRSIGHSLLQPLEAAGTLNKSERAETVERMLTSVGLRADHAHRFPHMFSGGQRQRIAIARALLLNPDLIVADEPVAALDVSIRAQIINLLMDLQAKFGVAYFFISHDINLVRHISDEVMVLYLGSVVEIGSKSIIFEAPRHPYTQALVDSAFSIDPSVRAQRAPLAGEPPSPFAQARGCAFQPRCPRSTKLCADEEPILRAIDNRMVACHHPQGG
jgi:peptide/nickel transport system ATP-binding protein